MELKVDKKPKMRAAETEFECLPMGMIGISVSGKYTNGNDRNISIR